MRSAIRRIIAAEDDLEIIAEASNGKQAVEIALQLKPDVITMDIEMPFLDGIAATKQILAKIKTCIIMVSSLTQRGTEATIYALQSGAQDYVSKMSSESTDVDSLKLELLKKIRFWKNQQKRVGHHSPNKRPIINNHRLIQQPDLVVVGVSTGGPRLLPQFLDSCSQISCPIVIAQHMPSIFIKSLAKCLDDSSSKSIVEGEGKLALTHNMVVIAPGGQSIRVVKEGEVFVINIFTDHLAAIQPSVNALFESALAVAKRPVAVVLTGMGNDGEQGAKQFALRKLPVLVQTPGSCIVDSMSRAVIEAGAASGIVTIDMIGKTIMAWST